MLNQVKKFLNFLMVSVNYEKQVKLLTEIDSRALSKDINPY